MAAASNLNEGDSLYGSSEDSGDERGAADNTTASTKKVFTAALLKAKRAMCRSHLSSIRAIGPLRVGQRLGDSSPQPRQKSSIIFVFLPWSFD